MKHTYQRICDNCELLDLKNSTVLITGSNGLLGGFLHNFFEFLNTEYSYNIKILLTSLSKESNQPKSSATYISQDLSNQKFTDHFSFIINQKKIDYCFYCAGYAQPFKFLQRNLETFFINTQSMRLIFEKIFNNNKQAKCTFISSAEIYALNNEPHCEDDDIKFSMDYKRNVYQLSKFAGEMIVNQFRDLDYDAKSIRVSACYGPEYVLDDKRVLHELVKKGLDNSSTIKLLDDGSAVRKYLHLSDFCVMLMNITLRGKERVYNATGETDISIYDIASFIGNHFHKTVVKGDGQGSFAPKKVNISLDRYIKEFGKINFYDFKQGLKDYINWYKK